MMKYAVGNITSLVAASNCTELRNTTLVARLASIESLLMDTGQLGQFLEFAVSRAAKLIYKAQVLGTRY